MARCGPNDDIWKDAAAYSPLLAVDRSVIAWEWLRRNSDYRHDAHLALGGSRRGRSDPASWGLHAWVSPDVPAPHSRPIWRADIHPAVLAARASQAVPDSADAVDFRCLAQWMAVAPAKSRQHLLLSDGLRSIRVDISGVSVNAGPVILRYLLLGTVSVEAPLLTLRRLLALARSGEFARTLNPPEARARRWILLLRTYDALCAGASQREIAEILIRAGAAEPNWRCNSPSLRSQAQRLVRGARHMASDGWRGLLD